MTTAERYRNIIAWFRENMPEVNSELHYDNAYELLVAVILSAQCTDKRVNMVTPALIERFPTPHHMAGVEPDDIYPYIKSVSYPNSKAQHLSGMARKLVSDFGGVVPDDLEALQTLPGVGRKTANVVGIVMFGKAVMPVDTHVFRVSDRLGLTTGAKNPLQAEMQLTEGFPSEWLSVAHHWLILHGRYVCLARKPRCEACGLTPWCRHYAAQQKKEAARTKEDQSALAQKQGPSARTKGASAAVSKPGKPAAKAGKTTAKGRASEAKTDETKSAETGVSKAKTKSPEMNVSEAKTPKAMFSDTQAAEAKAPKATSVETGKAKSPVTKGPNGKTTKEKSSATKVPGIKTSGRTKSAGLAKNSEPATASTRAPGSPTAPKSEKDQSDN